MSTLPIVVSHAKKRYDLDIDLSQPGEVFKLQLFSLTNVEPDRQKIIVKGRQVKDDTDLSTLGLKPGQQVIMMGTPSGNAIQAPKEKTKFVEDMSAAELAKTEGAIPSGLQNLGNTCYMNSTLQTLRFVPELQQELQNYRAEIDGGGSSSGFGGFGGSSSLLSGLGSMSGNSDLTSALRDLFKQMGETTEGFPPLMFLDTLRRAFPQFAEKGKDGRYSQQDAEECYSQIVTQLRTKLKIKTDNEDTTFVDKYLAGKLNTTMKCDEDVPDEMPVETVESFVNLKCHITVQTNHLRDGILAGLTEKLEKNSSSLGREAVYTKTSRISRLPKYLTCHFVRFFWKREINKKAKIMRKVTFPFELDATEFCTDELREKLIPVRDRLRDLRKDALDRERARKRLKMVQQNPDDIPGGNAGESGFGAGKGKDKTGADQTSTEDAEAAKRKLEEEPVADWEQELKDKLDPELLKDEGCNPSGLYDLMGVITHQGASADSGHYCSYVKKDGGDGKTWYFFNDDKVSEVDQDKIEMLSGGGESHSALILLYRAVPLTPPPSSN